jgi:PEP-CTERM motif
MPRAPSRSCGFVLCLVATVAWLSMSAFGGIALAEDVIFTIDNTASTETWSGTDKTYGPLGPQTVGSMSTGVEGHFVVSFDPTNDNPTSIQFIGMNNDGYFQLDNSIQNALPGGTPANVAGQSAGGEGLFAIRNLVWDFNSPVISGSGGSFPATTTSFGVNSGSIDYEYPPGNPQTSSYVGGTGTMTSGSWTLAQTGGSGSGDWTLTMNAAYTFPYDSGTTSGTMTASGNIVSTAHFGAANTTTVTTPSSGPVEAQVLGGAGTIGGVTLDFNQGATGGSLSVQQVPGITSLTQAAIAAGQANPVFALSTSDTSIGAPQIWNVAFGGNLNGGTATLVFDYDPSSLPAGTDQSQLGIWHFNENTGHWEFGGTVDTTNHTITFVTSSFSPFELGRAVPEPSTVVLLAVGLMAIAGLRLRRRQK